MIIEKNTVLEKIKRLSAEFLLIVLGVTIALWLENEFENMKERELESDYTASLLADWDVDIAELSSVIKHNKKLMEKTSELFNDLTQGNITDQELMSRIYILL